MTLMDKIHAFNLKYIAKSEYNKKDEPKENAEFKASDYDSKNRKFSSDKLTPEKRRKLAYAAPLYMKGMKKKLI